MHMHRSFRYLLTYTQRNFLRLLLSSHAIKCYHPLPWIGWVPQDRVAAVENRWRLIGAHLPSAPFSALDIGCNAGYFSLKMAESGGFVTGIEQARAMLWLARGVAAACEVDGVGFVRFSLDPDNVDGLPDYDIVLLLSVYHHFVHFYGADNARSILGALIRRTRRSLFFETAPSYDRGKQPLPDIGSLEETEEFLRSFAGVESVEPLGRRPSDGHERGLFLITK